MTCFTVGRLFQQICTSELHDKLYPMILNDNHSYLCYFKSHQLQSSPCTIFMWLEVHRSLYYTGIPRSWGQVAAAKWQQNSATFRSQQCKWDSRITPLNLALLSLVHSGSGANSSLHYLGLTLMWFEVHTPQYYTDIASSHAKLCNFKVAQAQKGPYSKVLSINLFRLLSHLGHFSCSIGPQSHMKSCPPWFSFISMQLHPCSHSSELTYQIGAYWLQWNCPNWCDTTIPQSSSCTTLGDFRGQCLTSQLFEMGRRDTY